jgi:hypothetical protein
MDMSMVSSLRERAPARTRSGDVSPEPPPFLNLQKAGSARGVPSCRRHAFGMTRGEWGGSPTCEATRTA